MEGQKRKRKRIPIGEGVAVTKIGDEESLYESNRCSTNVKRIKNHVQELEITLWFHRHYEFRDAVGDENGPREGIGNDVVCDLIIDSMKYLFFFGSLLPSFSFINRLNPKLKSNPIALVCRKETDLGMLNVIIQVHFESIYEYEVTILTAMCVEGFRIFDNQYVLELVDGGAVLSRMVNKQLVEVSSV